MARPLRIEFEGAIYHLTSRGNAQSAIYLDDKDHINFLDVLSHVVDRFGWICHAYCLMNNHYHLMIETPQANLSRGMRQLNGVYTQRFNRHHQRVGHIFQGRFKSIIVDKDGYLLELSRYIVRNPVVAGMVKDVLDWPWSSCLATAGKVPAPKFLHTAWLLSHFSQNNPLQTYLNFVRKADNHSPWQDLNGPDILGSDAFCSQLQRLSHQPQDEIPKRKQNLRHLHLSEIHLKYPVANGWMKEAYHKYGYTMREIAKHANLHYSTVSRLIKKAE